MSEKKKRNQIRYTDNDQINQLLNRLVSDVKEFTESQLHQIRRLAQIGVALSAERNIDRLFEMIVDEARSFTNADGGTLYIMSDDETELQFVIIQNGTLSVRMGGTGEKISWPAVPLQNPDGTPNHANVSAYAALSNEVVNIPDVYDAEGFNFEGTRRFDSGTGYRSESMLVVPMRNHENDIIGVLQLLNAQDRVTGDVITFSDESQRMTEALASQAAVALSNNRLILGLENLLESFIKTIAMAIDEKSPYTGGHVRRVAELTMEIAGRINEVKEGPFAEVHFNEDQLKELRIAAWLHDVGKITTPEYVVDKATKLETVFDRIETLKTRFEVVKRDLMIASLKQGKHYDAERKALPNEEEPDPAGALDDELQFLSTVNVGDEFMADDMVERVKAIAKRKLILGDEEQPLLTENEIYNLSIRRGTLNNEEREIINNHARMTHKMLSQLPFPKKLKRIPNYAAAHHEKLDGTGYPNGLKDAELPLQARILALADVFEALTAKDRPYKKGKTLSEAMKIMGFMVKDRHIDADLWNLFLKERIHLEYARRELSLRQIDITE
jgi:HD-GYP domain-containing protein (c-di-GMP phosphodiesterase class II)